MSPNVPLVRVFAPFTPKVEGVTKLRQHLNNCASPQDFSDGTNKGGE